MASAQTTLNVNSNWGHLFDFSCFCPVSITTRMQKLKEMFGFLHINPYNKDISDHIRCSQHYYDNWRNPESWSLLLMSPLAENHRGAFALVLTDMRLAECLVVSSHVLTPKHEGKHRYQLCDFGYLGQNRLSWWRFQPEVKNIKCLVETSADFYTFFSKVMEQIFKNEWRETWIMGRSIKLWVFAEGL